MTTLIDTRLAFSPRGLQLAFDSVSLGAAKKCARYYYYTILMGWRPKVESPHLKFGILFHSALEMLDHIKVQREPTDEDLRSILRKIMKDAGEYDAQGRFQPWASGHDKKNLESLIRGVIWYFDQYRNDAFRVGRLRDGRAAVELSFRFPLPGIRPGDEGEEFLYCGHLDRVGEYGGQQFVMDRKTTGGALNQQFFSGFQPSVQMTGYDFASRVVFEQDTHGVVIDAMQVLVGSVRFARQPISNTKAQLEEWLTGALYTIQQVQAWHKQAYWPMNEMACTMYGGCAMLGICSKDPNVRERFLEAGYEKKGWDPLETRGKTV